MEQTNTQTSKHERLKRQRSENWLEEDKNLLLELVRERVHIIENKNTQTNTNSKKVAAWMDLQRSFNAMCKGGPRSIPQLKSQWGIIKMAKKKQKAYERKETLKTGGGPLPKMEPDGGDEDITNWLPNEFIIDSNEFDSDQIHQIQFKSSEPQQVEVDRNEINNINILHANIEEDEPADIIKTYQIEDGEDGIISLLPSENIVPDRTSAAKRPAAPPKPAKNRKDKKVGQTAISADKIAQNEIACRNEIHELQMENEKKKARNLDLEAEVLTKKLELVEKKIKHFEK